jgi:hypothetical protein
MSAQAQRNESNNNDRRCFRARLAPSPTHNSFRSRLGHHAQPSRQIATCEAHARTLREAPRRLLSLSAYQRGMRANEYDVIVVDNLEWPWQD